jgi:hypothetical protein
MFTILPLSLAGGARSDKTNPIWDLPRRSIAAAPFNAEALTILGQLSEVRQFADCD